MDTTILMDRILDILIALGVALLGGRGLWAWLSSRRKSKAEAQKMTEEADAIATRTALDTMIKTVDFLKLRVSELDVDNIKLRNRVAKLEAQNEQAVSERGELIKKNLELCIENAKLEKKVEELETEVGKLKLQLKLLQED